jgi:hypothetical protein
MDALEQIAERGADDPRTRQVLLDRLEHDPSDLARNQAATLLAPLAQDETIRKALQDAADQDEDLQVRWAARYALRLALNA